MRLGPSSGRWQRSIGIGAAGCCFVILTPWRWRRLRTGPAAPYLNRSDGFANN